VEFEEYTRQILTETREELTRADSKASLLFAVFGVVLGALLAGLISQRWQPADLAAGATVVFWLGTALAALGAASLGWAVWPRVNHEQADGPASYFGDVVAYGADRAALRAGLAAGAASDERDVEQLAVISSIVWKKYAGIRLALRLFPAAAVLCAAAAIFG
jgi:hypothetical protein